MKLFKYILSILVFLILQLSITNSFANVFCNNTLVVNRIELAEKSNLDLSKLYFGENFIFEVSYNDIVTCPSISFCADYALVEGWKSFKNAGLDDLAINTDNLDALNKALKQGDYDAAYFENLLKTKSDPQKFIDDYVKKLGDDGKFIDSELETSYSNYLTRKAREGKTPRDRADWNHARDYWLNDSPMARGNDFNKYAEESGWYPFYEIQLANGKRVDSYLPGEYIISRKATNLEDISFETFDKYLKEMVEKYKPGTKVNSTKYRNEFKELGITELEGKMVLEIPESNSSFSKLSEYVEHAENNYSIKIELKPERP